MPKAVEYSVHALLRDERPITIRALRPDDRAGMLAAVGRTSMQSLQRRFFVPKKGFSEREMAFFLDIDFESHVAIVAEIAEDGRQVIIGGGRYIVVQPGQAEIAFIVIDAHQGRGIGTILMQHLAVLARGAGLEELVAEVLPENTAMLITVQEVRLPARRDTIASGGPPDAATALSTEILAELAWCYRSPRSERR